MHLVTIAWKSIRQRALSSSLTALTVALGVMLMVSVLVVHGLVERVFSQNSSGYNLVVGAKGSPLQLVLNTIYYLNSPVENIPYLYYKELQANPAVKHAIPMCMGDFTPEGGFRIVGTSPEFLEVPYARSGNGDGKQFAIKGDILRNDFDAVIGSHVARTLNWTIGSTFQPAHGVADADHVHEEKFTVVGILAPTGTPHDKAVFVHMDGFYQIAGHEKPADEAAEKAAAFAKAAGVEGPAPKPAVPHDDHAGHDHSGHDHHHHDIPDEQKEVTAVLLITKAPTLSIQLSAKINEEPYAQAAVPFQQISWLLTNVVGNVRSLLVVMTVLIIVVSGVGIFVSIYNSMADRKREIGVMRALGARRSTVFSIIFLESILLCVMGGVLGVLLGHGLVFVSAPLIEARSGLLINPWSVEPLELVILPALIALASIVGVVPGLRAYQTDVAQALSSG